LNQKGLGFQGPALFDPSSGGFDPALGLFFRPMAAPALIPPSGLFGPATERVEIAA
jgi:hypothetical protein